MATLLEKYKDRIRVAENVHAREHNGAKMDTNKKLVLATCLDNVSKFLNESFDAASGTQRADLGSYKKFCLNLTNIALPNLIAHDLVIVHPMTSMTGYVAYLEYTSAKTKGSVTNGQVFNSPFKLGAMDEGRANFTGDRVVEEFTATASQKDFPVAWAAATLEDGKLADGKVLVNGTATDAYTATTADGVTTVTLTAAASADDKIRIAYVYDNITVPQADLPSIKAEMKNIPLLAKARRLAVYYSQIAAFQAKTDYGFDLGDQLAEQAVGELSYEIDSEIVGLLDEMAGEALTDLTWSKTLPVGVNKRDHYAGFAEIAQLAAKHIYDATQKFAPNYMVASSAVLPVLSMCDAFTAAPAGQMNGPYYAGTFAQLKVFISPMMEDGEFIVGVNGNDMMSSAAVYAPYMAIVPTQLIQFADGGTTQGWSTMYDLKPLNDALVIKGKIIA